VSFITSPPTLFVQWALVESTAMARGWFWFVASTVD
jgi:hypothetical protein